MGYSDKYYRKHFEKYRIWENKVGEYLYNFIKPRSVLDLGCGIGSYLEGFFNAGCRDLMGIELNYNFAKKYIVEIISPFIKQGDITKDLNLNRKFDCVISFEVREHVDPNGTQSFIDNLSNYSQKYIIFTAAPPGQRGTGHINLMDKNKWIQLVVDRGFLYQEDLVKEFKNEWIKFGTERYILSNLMVFKNGK
jgi:cyclopropane fatty-acyl-phospholipid synthase-like methyltransferase